MTATDYFVWGFVVHLLCDFFLQNEYQALNKVNWKHPAAWLHSGIHFGGALLVFPFWAALFISATHLCIDTRAPLIWWRILVKQTRDAANPVMVPFAMLQDQVAHLLVIAIAAQCSVRML